MARGDMNIAEMNKAVEHLIQARILVRRNLDSYLYAIIFENFDYNIDNLRDLIRREDAVEAEEET